MFVDIVICVSERLVQPQAQPFLSLVGCGFVYVAVREAVRCIMHMAIAETEDEKRAVDRFRHTVYVDESR